MGAFDTPDVIHSNTLSAFVQKATCELSFSVAFMANKGKI